VDVVLEHIVFQRETENFLVLVLYLFYGVTLKDGEHQHRRGRIERLNKLYIVNGRRELFHAESF